MLSTVVLDSGTYSESNSPSSRHECPARRRAAGAEAPPRARPHQLLSRAVRHHVCRHYSPACGRCVAGSGRIVGGVTPAPWTVLRSRNLARIAPRDHTPLGKSRGPRRQASAPAADGRRKPPFRGALAPVRCGTGYSAYCRAFRFPFYLPGASCKELLRNKARTVRSGFGRVPMAEAGQVIKYRCLTSLARAECARVPDRIALRPPRSGGGLLCVSAAEAPSVKASLSRREFTPPPRGARSGGPGWRGRKEAPPRSRCGRSARARPRTRADRPQRPLGGASFRPRHARPPDRPAAGGGVDLPGPRKRGRGITLRSRVVEGASDSTLVPHRQRSSDSEAPSTAQTRGPPPPLSWGRRQYDPVPARALRARAMSNSDICLPPPASGDRRPSNPEQTVRAVAEQLFAARFRQIKGKAERRQSHCNQSRTERVRSRHGRAACAARPLRARSPAGVPPRLFPRGVWSLGAIRARFRGQTVQGAGVTPPTIPPLPATHLARRS